MVYVIGWKDLDLLVDMDGVQADIAGGFDAIWSARHPNKILIPFEQRRKYFVEKVHPEYFNEIQEIFLEDGFFRNLKPIPGSLEALERMLSLGINVTICTKPFPGHKTCEEEKREWVKYHLGNDWLNNRLDITHDKSKTPGHFLIDDEPNIRGASRASWQHILYTQPYNELLENRMRLTWADWEGKLKEYYNKYPPC